MTRLLAGICLVALATSGCGSTAQNLSTGASGRELGTGPASSPGAGGSVGAAGTAGGPQTNSGATGAGGSSSAGATTSGSSGTTSGTIGSGTAGSRAVPSRATGLAPVQVGFQTVKNNASTASSLGFKGLDNGDEKQVVQALITAANAAGGLAGHRIVPVWFEVDPASTSSYAELGQQACARFTEDSRVVAAAGTALFDTANACLSKRGIPAFNGSTQLAYSEAQLRRMPTVATFGITQRRQAKAVVEAAAAQRYLADAPKVGIISIDTPAFHDAVDSTLLPALRAHGGKVDTSDVVYGPDVTQTSDLSAVATAMQSAVLRFRSDGVTHVVFLTSYAAAALLFMEQADSQQVTFRYALSSNDAPQTLVGQGVSARQFSGAVAAGWDPYLDVRPDKAGSPPTGRSWCNRALAKLGLAPGSNAEWIAYMHCDAVQLLLAAGRHVQGGLTSASLDLALGTVGALPSADTWSANISRDHRWAVSGYLLNRYDNSCSCFTYLKRDVVAV